jgi:hypothetical protein
MFGEDITWSRVVIDNKRLTFIPHVNYGVGRGDMVTGQLSPLTCRKSKMSIKNKALTPTH